MSEMKTSKVKGSISLVNMSDIVKTAGVGIKNTEVYYATSNSGTVPPELEDASLKTELNGEIITLSFASLGTSFLLEDEVLFGYQNGKKIPLILENGNIIGTKGWQLGIIPEVAPGEYLWSKTVYYFTNGNISTTYGVSRQGEQGPQGIPGPQAAMYKLASNYSEILGFVQKGEKPSEDEVVFSPNKISFFVLQENAQKVNTKVKLIKDNFRIQLYVPETGEEPQDVKNDCFDLNENGDECIINLEPNSTFRTNYPLTEKYEVIIIYSYTLETEEETFYLTNYVNIRYGLTKDMAQFSLEANGIVQAVRNSKMEFTADGLKIYNGGFEIVKKEGNNPEIQLLNFDKTGNLKVSGIIDALGGTIGGFNIESDRLYSKAKIKIDDPDDSNNKIETDNPAIVINGNNGEIIADQITLGTGAKIDNYIQLGTDAYIRNPDINNGVFLESKNLSVSNEGKMKIGKIELSGGTNKGEDAYIRDIGDKWRIQGDGKAIFNDVYANNVHLQDTILEIGTVQSLGSLMLFKDSWTTQSIEKDNEATYFIVDGRICLYADDWIYTPEGPFKIEEITYFEAPMNFTKIKLYKSYPISQDVQEIIFTKFGKSYKALQTADLSEEEVESNLTKDGFIISILGSEVITDINRTFASSNSLTISDFTEKNDNLEYRKRLVLGQLDGIKLDKENSCSGLGLYADNVFLKGSLTTRTEKNSYAGINTNTSVKPKLNQLNDETKIVFWAGASSSSSEDIQEAPFFITAGGSLYAQKGIFKGEIRAADIYTAKIHGINNDGDASSLIVYDDSNGVIFMEHAEEGEKETFSITTKGLARAEKPIIEIGDDISFHGDQLLLGKDSSLLITEKGLTSFITKNDLTFSNFYQHFDEDGIVFGGSEEASKLLAIKEDGVHLIVPNLFYDGNGVSNEAIIQYKKVTDGLDLFVVQD